MLAITGFVVIMALYVSASYNARAPLAFEDKYREVWYWVAIVGFGASILEGIVHIGIAQVDVPVGGEFGIALVVVLLPNLFAMGLIFLNMYHTSDKIQTGVGAPRNRHGVLNVPPLLRRLLHRAELLAARGADQALGSSGTTTRCLGNIS